MNQINPEIPQKKILLHKNSRQRFALLDLLKSTKSHPTAAWLYDQLKARFPNLSHGTVYRNLGILSDMGLLRVLHSGSTFDRFDADTSVHYHVVCEKCGKIEDIPIAPERDGEKKAEQMSGYKISSHRLDFLGICPDCQKSGT